MWSGTAITSLQARQTCNTQCSLSQNYTDRGPFVLISVLIVHWLGYELFKWKIIFFYQYYLQSHSGKVAHNIT